MPNRSLTSSSWQVPTYRASPQKSCDQREPFPSEVPGNGTLVSIHVLCSAHCLLTWRYFSLLRFSFSYTINTSHLVFSAQFITLPLKYGWKTDQKLTPRQKTSSENEGEASANPSNFLGIHSLFVGKLKKGTLLPFWHHRLTRMTSSNLLSWWWLVINEGRGCLRSLRW